MEFTAEKVSRIESLEMTAAKGDSRDGSPDRASHLFIVAAWVSFAIWLFHGHAIRALLMTVLRLAEKFLGNV